MKLDNCVNTGWSHRLIFVIPAEQFFIKIFCGVGVGCAEFDPTEAAGFLIGEFLHSRFGHWSKSSSMEEYSISIAKKHKKRRKKALEELCLLVDLLVLFVVPKTKCAALSKL